MAFKTKYVLQNIVHILLRNGKDNFVLTHH